MASEIPIPTNEPKICEKQYLSLYMSKLLNKSSSSSELTYNIASLKALLYSYLSLECIIFLRS
jgi:hypothetical protein